MFRMSLSVLLLFPVALNASDDDVRRRLDKRVQKQVAKLVREYKELDESLEKREAMVEQAVSGGVPFALPVWTLVQAERQTALQLYEEAFYRSLDAASQIDAAVVVQSNKSLGEMRDGIVRLSAMSVKLRAVVNPRHEEQLALIGRSAKDGLQGISSHLADLEQSTIQRWMVAKGYQRLTQVETTLIAEVNRRRAKEKLPPLDVDYKLCVAARDHSCDMVRKRFFSHTSKLPNKKSFVDRAKRFGTTAAAENIGNGPDLWTIMSLWMASTGHKRAILEASYRRVGVGQVGRKYTMMLGARLHALELDWCGKFCVSTLDR